MHSIASVSGDYCDDSATPCAIAVELRSAPENHEYQDAISALAFGKLAFGKLAFGKEELDYGKDCPHARNPSLNNCALVP